jgi:hypothetical protein
MGMLWPGLAASGAAHRLRASQSPRDGRWFCGAKTAPGLTFPRGRERRVSADWKLVRGGASVEQARAGLRPLFGGAGLWPKGHCAAMDRSRPAGWGKGGWDGRGERRFRACPPSVVSHIRLL